MGSLKDEMRGVGEDHQICEKTDDMSTGVSDISSAPEGRELSTGHEATGGHELLTEAHMNSSAAEDRDKTIRSKDQVLSGQDGGNSDGSDNKEDKDFLTDEGDENVTALHNNARVAIEFSDGEGEGADFKKDENTSCDTENNADIDNILVPVPSTPNPCDPRSPAPFGQQHMRTQVSLEVVQCCSVATSPMTPPEGDHSFFFPSSFGKFATADAVTKDAELQVGQKVEFCSVATSPMPMTPMTAATTAFPELIERETMRKDGKTEKHEEKQESGQQEASASSKSPEEDKSEKTGTLKFCASKELAEICSSSESPDTTTNITTSGLIDSQRPLEDGSQQRKQPRMGSLDQDITILVTHYVNSGEEEEDKEESCMYFTEPEMAKIDETVEEFENSGNIKKQNGKQEISTGTNDSVEDISSAHNQNNNTNESSDPTDQQSKKCKEVVHSEMKESKCEDSRDVSRAKPPVPESPAPFGCHNMRTQVSLEVVQCQSAATSPMTPPEGDQAFCFPSSLGKCTSVGTEMKDAEMQVGQQVEYRSVATAPMTPRTPTTMTFPEVRKEKSIEEKIVEEEEDAEERDDDKKDKVIEGKEKITAEEKVEAADQEAKNETAGCQENDEEKCEEPVQEVSWDEKGMTWEVYGAVVEVAVLGSAIQKHLEKQVKKQKMQATLPPPPPLSPSATPLTIEPIQRGSGSGKGRVGKRAEKEGKVARRRRNPFRQLMENMQQPNCCSRAHTTE